MWGGGGGCKRKKNTALDTVAAAEASPLRAWKVNRGVLMRASQAVARKSDGIWFQRLLRMEESKD